MPPKRSLDRLLIIRNDRIGDLVLSLPAFAEARQAFPETRITVLTSPATAPLLKGNPHIDEVLLDDPTLSGWQLGRRLRDHAFDAGLAMAAYPRNCRALWQAGIPLRVTWGYKPSALLFGNRRVLAHRSRPPLHESEFALAFVRRLAPHASADASTANLTIDPAAQEHVRERIASDLGTDGPFFGVHPGNFQSAYNWPASRYAELISRLAEQGRVMVTGGPSERPLLAEIGRLAALPSAARVEYYHDLSLPEMVAALAEQDVLTVSSTGPMHMAGVLGTPLVALFSRHPSHCPEKWRPLGERHLLLQPNLLPGETPVVPKELGTAHMERIQVDEVVAANLSLLSQPIGV